MSFYWRPVLWTALVKVGDLFRLGTWPQIVTRMEMVKSDASRIEFLRSTRRLAPLFRCLHSFHPCYADVTII